MTHSYQPLPLHRLDSGTRFLRPKHPLSQRVTLDDPAIAVMTDLSRVTAITVERSTPLDTGLDRMIKRGVRILFVCDSDGGIIGLLTSRDISSDKANRILNKTGGDREGLVVADVMTIRPKLDVLLMEDILRARVGDIIVTLRHVDRQHALVLDRDPEIGKQAVRGIFSLSQIGLQLGLNIEPSQQSTTYAQLARAGCVL
ncbi:MAG: CBS domain-containing protein [Candidatus Competibacteraceae bacterium]|nr:CBS domain-containing protein [Candidatus Competibacteraceae bacterium]